MRIIVLIIGLLIGTSSFSQDGVQTLPGATTFLHRSVLAVEAGYDQFDRGFFYAGLRRFEWNDIRFSGISGFYGYNPWEKLHSLKMQLDYSIYFPSIGLTTMMVTDGETVNVAIRPQLGLFFVFGNIYLGPNILVNKHHENALNSWVFNVALTMPIKRWD